MNEIKTFIILKDFPETCSDWEEFDGIECVCASTSVGCRDDDGMVCDEHGIQYRSSCFFALQMCQQNISIDDNIVSCGTEWQYLA